jgi:hypothetical protein
MWRLSRCGNSPGITVYRKPTNTDINIHFASNHPMEHKMAAYRYLIDRANMLPVRESNKNKK